MIKANTSFDVIDRNSEQEHNTMASLAETKLITLLYYDVMCTMAVEAMQLLPKCNTVILPIQKPSL